MQSENRFFDDLAKVVNGAAGTLAGMGREGQAGMRERMRSFVGGLDLVSRDEFEAVKLMAAAAREQNDALRARVQALEAALAEAGASSANPSSAGPSSAGPSSAGPSSAGPSSAGAA